MSFESIYNTHYKKLLIIPTLLLVLSIIYLLSFNASTGELVKRDVSLKGGVELTLQVPNLDPVGMENYLLQNFEEVSVRTLTDFTTQSNIGLIIEVPDISSDQLQTVLQEKVQFTEQDISIKETGASLGQSFFRDLITALIIAFVLMALTVLITFRTLIPSLAVVLAAITDIAVTLAIINLLGVKISSAGIVAFLLILGYSIDTDILLTTKIIKRRQGPLMDRLKSAMTTGLTMTVTTIVALTLALVVTNSVVLKQMFLIIVIALVVDIIATYLGNAPLLIWYAKKKDI